MAGRLTWLAPFLFPSLLYSSLLSVGTNVLATSKEWTIPLGTATSLPWATGELPWVSAA